MKKGHILSACLAAVAGIVLGFQPAKEPQIVAQAEVPKSSHAPSKVPDCLCPSGTPRAKGFQPTGLMAFQGVPAEISTEQRFQLWKEHALEEMASLGVPAGSLHQNFPTLLSYVKDGKQIEYRMNSSAKLIGLRNGTVEVQYHVPDRPYAGFSVRDPVSGISSYQEVITTQRDAADMIQIAVYVPTNTIIYQANTTPEAEASSSSPNMILIQAPPTYQNDFLDRHWGNLIGTQPPFSSKENCLELSRILYEDALKAAERAHRDRLLGFEVTLSTCIADRGIAYGAVGSAIGSAIGAAKGAVAGGIGALPGAAIGGVVGLGAGYMVATGSCWIQYLQNVGISERTLENDRDDALEDLNGRIEFCDQFPRAKLQLH